MCTAFPYAVFAAFLAILPGMCPVASAGESRNPAFPSNAVSASGYPDVGKLDVPALVDMLQREEDQGIGTHATANASGFLAVDQEPRFVCGILGSPKPKTSPVMRELVRRGLSALPSLIAHVSDARPTGLVIVHTSSMGTLWQSDEYDPRSIDPGKQPPGVNAELATHTWIEKARKSTGRYTVCVGDLCYVAIGQIVNRNLSVVRYQPTACIVVNSPVQTPALAAAVRQDWSRLTPDQHRESLSRDVRSMDPGATGGAMVRLLFYYPKEAEDLALRLLARPLYEDDLIWDFVMKRLVKKDDPAGWRTMVKEFGKAHGQAAADAVPFWLHWIYWRTSLEENAEFLAGRRRASQMLARLYPDYDPHAPSTINAATPNEQVDLIVSLAESHSSRIDWAVHRVFQAAVQRMEATARGRVELDRLLFCCMSRLQGKGHDREFRGVIARRIEAEENAPQDPDRSSLDALRLWREKLGK